MKKRQDVRFSDEVCIKALFCTDPGCLFVFMFYSTVNIYSVMSGCFHGLNQYLHVAKDKVSCSRTQHSASACADPERLFRGGTTFF